jgi:hypothetical protein
MSNVMHRNNTAGKTKINHFRIEEYTDPMVNKQTLYRVVSRDTDHVMTHVIGVDFNSLYPFSMGSIPRPWIRYHGGLMYMPGGLQQFTEDKTLANVILKDLLSERFTSGSSGLLFVTSIKGHRDNAYLNDYINFPPIMRNLEIDSSDSSVVGPVTTKQIGMVEGKKGGKERRLTQLLSTHDQFMAFSSYYLFFLIDECHFVIDDVQAIATFSKTTCFNKFVTTFMGRRI